MMSLVRMCLGLRPLYQTKTLQYRCIQQHMHEPPFTAEALY